MSIERLVDCLVGRETLERIERAAAKVHPASVERRALHLFRGGLVFKAHRLCVSLNSRLDSNQGKIDCTCGEGRAREGRCSCLRVG